jgi:queuine tRNA-ribosyltransferase
VETITIKGNTYKLPQFLPDATRAVVKSVDSNTLKSAQIEGVVVNTYHLMHEPGPSVIEASGGIKSFMNFDGLVTTDSGGWQIFSLIHRNKNAGSITDKGVSFAIGKYKKKLFTPEDSIDIQFKIGSDIIICLDDFTDPAGKIDKITESVTRTTLWAKRCKDRYNQLCEQKGLNDKTRPHIYSVVQGGANLEMRQKSAEELNSIGFDGFGFGGYLVDENSDLDLNVAQKLTQLIPQDKVRFALGTGSPYEIAMCRQFGWDIFDCTLPTRDARHMRLYVFNEPPQNMQDLLKKEIYGYLYIKREEFTRDFRPIEEACDCYTCKNYTRAYLHHLFKIEDTLAFKLATIHNLRHYTKVIQLLRH